MQIKLKWEEIYRNIKRFKFNPNTFTFLFFLLVSTIFWFFNALNKEYVATINVPVKFVNFPENKLLAGDFVDRLQVKVEASGYSFLKYNSAPISEATINLKLHSIYPVSENDNKRFYLLSSTIQNEISAQLDGATSIKSISPDSIIFELDEVIKKKVPVRNKLHIECRKQYMLKDSVKIIPDSISIRGVKSVLDTLNEVFTEEKHLKDVYDSLSLDLMLKPVQGVAFSQSSVKCTVPVEEFAEISFVLPIEIENLPSEYNLELFPARAKVICNVVFSQYRQIFPQQFRFIVDYNDVKRNPNQLKVNLIKYPQNVSSVRYYPIAVDYLLEEND